MIRVGSSLEGAVYFLAMVGVASYGLAALVTVADILGRQIGLPIVGVVDLVQLFVLVGAWFVIPYAFLVGSHVSIDLVIGRLPASLVAASRVLAAILAIGLLALMLRHGYATFQTQLLFGDRSQQLGIPISWFWVPLLFGLAVSVLAAFITLLRALRGDLRQ